MTAYRPEQTEEHLRGEMASLRKELESVKHENALLLSTRTVSISVPSMKIATLCVAFAGIGSCTILWCARATGPISTDVHKLIMFTIIWTTIAALTVVRLMAWKAWIEAGRPSQ